jgi:hypothetical protein
MHRLVFPLIIDQASGINFILSIADEISWKNRNPKSCTGSAEIGIFV